MLINKKAQNILIFVLLLVTSFLMFFLTYQFGKDYIYGFYSSSNLQFEYPNYAYTDPKGNSYIIDNSRRRLVKVNSDSLAEWQIEGGRRGRSSFFYANEVTVDLDGNVYLLSVIPDEAGQFTQQEKIVKLTSTGEFIDVIFTKSYTSSSTRKNTLVQRGHILSLQYKNGIVSWFHLTMKGVILYEYNTSTQRLSYRTAVELKDADIFVSGVTKAATNFIYSTKQGFIFLHKENKDEVLYSGDANSDSKNFSIPWAVKYNYNSDLLFTDLGARSIYVLHQNKKLPILNGPILEGSGYPDNGNIFYNFSINDKGTITVCDSNSIIIMNPDGRITKYFSEADFKPEKTIIKYICYFVLFLAAALFIFSFYYCYVNVLNRRISLIIKQIAIFTPIIVITVSFVSYRLISHFNQRYQNEVVKNMSQMAQVMPKMITGDLFYNIRNQKDFMNPDYKKIREQLHNSLNYNQDSWNNSLYFAVYRVINNKLYGFMFLNDGISTVNPFDYGYEDPESLYRKAYNGEIGWETDSDISGDWIYALGPIKDSAGNVVAILEVGTDLYSFNKQNQYLLEQMIKYIVVVVFILVFAIAILTFLLLASIRNLRNGVNNITEGKWDYKIRVRKSNDEVEDLQRSFNRMSEYINNYLNEITNLNTGYRRFVPEQFLNFLDKESVTQVHLGDQVQKEMSILFSDIRSFTELSEKMTPKENFDFINSYLKVVGPLVRKNSGFIDKYIGDAVMALFPASADDAIAASIDILNILFEFNETRITIGESPIKCGFGIHTGLLMLGIVGEEERVDSTVISDNVNLASRLEGLTKHFGSSIIISETTYKALKNPLKYCHRNLGRVTVKGKNASISLYEIMDGISGEERDLKIKTKELFEKGVKLYQKKEFKSARMHFMKVLKYNPNDKISNIYIKNCFTFMNSETPEDWNGTIKMTDK